ncbi:MAG: asparagine synthase (glutamine-hydrolyzing) [Acidobacteria bacterium]|nr:MAG: asparagine synthase (glutamine-hydrolyzing) [Acidobacteriota bacterium]
MCGICGWIEWDGRADEAPVRRMAQALAHRGPDGEGLWKDTTGSVVLGHRRLAVLDLSARADQPMVDASGAALVYNGEVFGYRELRAVLEGEGKPCQSSGDTEVVLQALAHWGPDALERFDGQFALGFWNSRRRRLLLARDRLGIKPLFWAQVDRGIVFASELPALLKHPHVRRDLDLEALPSWLQLGYGPGEQTLVRGVRRLPPGHLLIADESGVRLKRWYDPLAAIQRRTDGPGARNEAVEQLGVLLKDSVRRRLVSDVPLGCFLSGGVDSGVVAGAAVAEGAHPETLTVRFSGGEDESGAASEVARALGLDHRIADCVPSDLAGALQGWGRATGDPLADPSFLPTSLVSGEARRHWTVALSGDGGDELLSGYPRLRAMPRLERLMAVPRPLRRIPGVALPKRRWASKLRAALAAPDSWFAYQALQGVWPAAEAANLLGRTKVDLPWDEALLGRIEGFDPWTRWRALDLLTFLPERMLAKVDRASMQHGLEARVPLLDHRIVEFLLSVNPKWTRDKGLFRDVATGLSVPPRSRHKVGFEIPLGNWLRGPLREKVQGLITGTTASELGLQRAVLDRHWQDHQAGAAEHGERLLAVAVLVGWVEDLLG